jgi:hypothetical protein
MFTSLRKTAMASASLAFILGGVFVPGLAAADPPPPYGGYASIDDAHQAWEDCVHHKTGSAVAGALIGGTMGALIAGAATGHGGGAAVGAGVGGVSGAAIGSASTDCGPEPVAGGYYGPGYYTPGPPPGPAPVEHGYYEDRGPVYQDCTWARAWVYMPDGATQNTHVRVCRDQEGRWDTVN